MLPLAAGAGAMVAATAASRARRESGWILRLLASQGGMLVAAGMMVVALQRSPSPGNARQVLLQPGSRLPPNEIFGSESALSGILVPLLAVGALAVPGLLLSVLLGTADARARTR